MHHRQVFWLVDQPPGRAFPCRFRIFSRGTVASGDRRPHSQRRVRTGFPFQPGGPPSCGSRPKVTDGHLPILSRQGLGESAAIVNKGIATIETLPIFNEHAFLAGQRPLPHKDPFDRMLVARARIESPKIISNDSLLNRYDVDAFG
jgi:hypothetical protein